MEYKSLRYSKIHQKAFDKNLQKKLPINTNYLKVISISLFNCCKEVFNHMNALMIAKN